MRTHIENSMIPQDRDGFAPGKLWSLWEVVEDFKIDDLTVIGVRSNALFRIGLDSPQRSSPIGEAGRNTIANIFSLIKTLPNIPLTHRFIDKLDITADIKTNDALMSVQSIIHSMNNELDSLKFFVLDAGEEAKYGKERLFGNHVFERFPSARMDIEECGSCFATGRYNGAVFHAICASEFGLRVLAKDRRVAPTQYKKPIAIEQAQWGTILNSLEKQIDLIDGWKAGPAKDAAHQFYKPSFVEASALNDGWRRHIMHARGARYEKDETLALIGHAERFLQRLGTRLGEGLSETPMTWKSALAGLSRK